MGANSVTGTGLGSARKLTTKELAILANGPSILFSGVSEAITNEVLSPPTILNTVVFPYALPGGEENYVIIITSLNSGFVYVTTKNEDDDGNLIGFTFIAEAEGSIMYLVSKVGVRPLAL
jgi:hypothetical protein